MKITENENIILRALEPEDLDLLYIWENDSSLWITGNARAPYSRFQLRQYIAQVKNDIYTDGALRLMIDDKNSGETIGIIDLFNFDMHHSRVALGIFIDEPNRGKGFASEALKLMERYVFDFLKINQIYAHVSVSNNDSHFLFEKEYEQTGKLKSWLKTPEGFEDILIYQKFLTK